MSMEGFDNFEQIGEGGMAVVWKAHQMSLDRTVAIKVLKSDLAANPEEVIDFINEAKSAASLKHPNIIQAYDAAEDEGVYYFIMEYIAGQTVSQVLQQGPIHWKKMIQIAAVIAEALEYASNKLNLIHRDIKPENIMFDDDGTIKLADLGLAKRMDTASLAAQIQVRKLEGTPNYMSPEQAKCLGKLDFRTDMYSLGATMYHMVTGRLPFAEYQQMEVLEMQIKGSLPNPRDIIPSIPLGIVQLITKLMMKDPNDRFTDWTEARREIKKVSTGRVMITKQTKLAKSTISQPEKKAADEIIGKKTPRAESMPTPIWIRVPAWSILALWWIYLVGSICNMPPVPSLPKPISPEIKKPLATVAAPPTIKPTVEASLNKNDQATNVTVATNMQPPQVASNILQASDEEKLLLHSLKLRLTECIMNQTYTEAINYITKERQYSHSVAFEEEMQKMEEYINAISEKGQVLEAAFKKKIGQDSVIRIKGNDWPVIIRSVENGIIKVDLKSTVGDSVILRPGSITFAQLEPMECIRWIGPADTEVKCIAIFALSYKARDHKLALKAAEKCGPFAEVFKTKIEQENPTPQP
ncbi:MAG: serine/threonine-protein kinase [Kiritimatiellae bacterium]|nr:serine/threonine-protein kinase [Kiritimatiellia bacterium]